MAAPKKSLFAKEDVRLAKYAKALSHPARIEILRQLVSLRKCCFNDISGNLPLADSTVSQHLSELKSAGLIRGRYDPPNVWYTIDQENWKSARKSLKEISRLKIPKDHK